MPKPWTSTEDATLRRLYSTHSPQVIADHMGRTLASVKSRARKIGATERTLWTDAERQEFKRLYPDTDNTALSTLFNRSLRAIHQGVITMKARLSRVINEKTKHLEP